MSMVNLLLEFKRRNSWYGEGMPIKEYSDGYFLFYNDPYRAEQEKIARFKSLCEPVAKVPGKVYQSALKDFNSVSAAEGVRLIKAQMIRLILCRQAHPDGGLPFLYYSFDHFLRADSPLEEKDLRELIEMLTIVLLNNEPVENFTFYCLSHEFPYAILVSALDRYRKQSELGEEAIRCIVELSWALSERVRLPWPDEQEKMMLIRDKLQSLVGDEANPFFLLEGRDTFGRSVNAFLLNQVGAAWNRLFLFAARLAQESGPPPARQMRPYIDGVGVDAFNRSVQAWINLVCELPGGGHADRVITEYNTRILRSLIWMSLAAPINDSRKIIGKLGAYCIGQHSMAIVMEGCMRVLAELQRTAKGASRACQVFNEA